MSQYRFTNDAGREVLYGLDKPTGGYFFIEFYTDREMQLMVVDEEVSDVVRQESSLTLTELIGRMIKLYNYFANTLFLANDWDKDGNPTKLQFNVSTLFGKDLSSMLLRVAIDLQGYLI